MHASNPIKAHSSLPEITIISPVTAGRQNHCRTNGVSSPEAAELLHIYIVCIRASYVIVVDDVNRIYKLRTARVEQCNIQLIFEVGVGLGAKDPP